jgi:hypothetical protein
MKRQQLIGENLRKNKSCVGRGAIINFKTHNKQRKQSEEREEIDMINKMNKMNIKGSGNELKKLTPLKFKY